MVPDLENCLRCERKNTMINIAIDASVLGNWIKFCHHILINSQQFIRQSRSCKAKSLYVYGPNPK